MGCGASKGESKSTADKRFAKEDDFDEFQEASIIPFPVSSDNVGKKYKNGHPTFEGDTVTPCFDQGLLYKIEKNENPHGSHMDENVTWAFYNDTRSYEMHVVFTFGRQSRIRALETTRLTEANTKKVKRTNKDGVEEEIVEEGNGELTAERVCYPGETILFITGEPAGFHSKIRAVPLSDGYIQSKIDENNKIITEELEALSKAAGLSPDAATEDVVKACLQHHLPFVDTAFPPQASSIFNAQQPPPSLSSVSASNMRPLPWARPKMYLPEDYVAQERLFRLPIGPLSIDQGDLGDSWLMSAIAVLSENKNNIINLFHHPVDKRKTPEEERYGIYRVMINKGGWWRSVIVDNYFPFLLKRLKYAKSFNDPCEMWVSVIEKAYAKIHNNYFNIVSGDPLLAMMDFSGFPISRYDKLLLEEIQQDQNRSEMNEIQDQPFFHKLLEYKNKQYDIILNTPNPDPSKVTEEEKYKVAGLIMGHAYTVSNIIYYENKNNNDVKVIRLMQIRNPWIRDVEWKGEWGANCKNWELYPDLAEACGMKGAVTNNAEKKTDSALWMSWDDVKKYFNGCGVLFSQPNAIDYRVKGSFSGSTPSVCLSLTVKKKMDVSLILSQDERRGTNRADKDYPPIMLSVCHHAKNENAKEETYKVSYNTNITVDSPNNQFTFMQSRDVSMMCTLTPEESPYMIIPRIILNDTSNNNNTSNIVVAGNSAAAKAPTPESDLTPFTIGMLTDQEMGSSDCKAEFKSLPADNPVFNNYLSFGAKNSKSVSAEFQIKYPFKGFPEEFTGKELSEKKGQKSKK